MSVLCKMKNKKSSVGILAIIGAVALSSWIIGCGGATSNDQGTSFLALGFFDEGGDSTGDLPAGDGGVIVRLNQDVEGTQGATPNVYPLFVPIDKDTSKPGIQGGFIGVENRLTKQFIRLVRVDCDHSIPGADPSLTIPSDSFPIGNIIAPAVEDSDGNVTGSRAFDQIFIVSPDVMSFINVNQNLLPKLPFRMVSQCSVVGVTQSGDTLVTNQVNYFIQFADNPECCPGEGTPGFQTGAGSGGTL